MLQLQRTIENQPVQLPRPNTEEPQARLATSASACFAHDSNRIAVQRKAPVEIQAKLTANTPGDIYEQEANCVSDQVMRMTVQQGAAGHFSCTPKDLPSIQITKAAPAIQRRTGGMAGSCIFENCQNQLGNFFMIPEDGPPGFHPSGSEVDNVDGLWFKFHTPKNEWFKISDFGAGYVTCTDNKEAPYFSYVGEPIYQFTTRGPLVPKWTADSIHTPNPWLTDKTRR